MGMRLAFFFLLSGTAFAAMAQVPEKIHGKNKRLMPNGYYVEQVGLWRAEVAKEPQNAEAWYNYYRASRNAYIKGDEQENTDTRGTGRFGRLQGIVDSMAVRVPESFEFHHVRWMNGYGDVSLLPYLLRECPGAAASETSVTTVRPCRVLLRLAQVAVSLAQVAD